MIAFSIRFLFETRTSLRRSNLMALRYSMVTIKS